MIGLFLPRILVTLGILLLIKSGTFLPVPGIDLIDLACYIQGNSVANNLISTFSGENTFVIGLFTLNIFPYINATILIQFLIAFSPELSKLQKEGDFEGRRTISRLTRYITLLVAIIQSIGIALYLRSILFDWNLGLAIQIVIWLTAGAMIVLYLSELITDYGLGNGTSLLIYVNIISNLPNVFKKLMTDNNDIASGFSLTSNVGLLMITVASFYWITFLQGGTLKIPLISSRQLNQSAVQDRYSTMSYIPLRLNQAGVMPIILTTSFLVIPNYLINLGIFQSLNFLTSYKWIYWIGYFFLIVAFSLFYSSIVLNPKDLSDQLQKMAVKIQGVRPGIQTIFYLKQELQRLTFAGAILLAVITITPNFLESTFHLTNLNGLSATSFLILGGVILDLKREISNIYFSNIYKNTYR
jgi:preprotein translocase subunit SecY